MDTEEWLSHINSKCELRQAFGKCKLLILIHEEYEGTEPIDPEMDRLQQHLKALKTKALLMGIQLEKH